MRSTSFAATASVSALVAVTAGVGLLVTAPGAASADATKSSAYGVQVTAGGQEAVPPTPYVESTDGSSKEVTGGQLPANPLGLAATLGQLTAGDDEASVELTDLQVAPDATQLPPEAQQVLDEIQTGCDTLTTAIPDGELPDTLPEELQDAVDQLTTQLEDALGEAAPGGGAPSLEDLTDFCAAFDATAPLVTIGVVSVDCEGDQGGVELADVTLLGQPVPVPPAGPDTAVLPENPLLTITANRQTTTADDGFSVDGLAVELAGGEAEAVVANATCGETIAQPATDPVPPAAPAPAPVPGSAPVTG